MAGPANVQKLAVLLVVRLGLCGKTQRPARPSPPAQVCVHRLGWNLILHADGSTEAHGPDGEILRSHGPPTGQAA